jgi:hypothetical protein
VTSKRRRNIAILLFLQAMLFGYYVVFDVVYGLGAAGMVLEPLAAAWAVVLGIFVWRGSMIAVIVVTIVCGIEVVFFTVSAAPVFRWSSLTVIWLLLRPLPCPRAWRPCLADPDPVRASAGSS